MTRAAAAAPERREQGGDFTQRYFDAIRADDQDDADETDYDTQPDKTV